MARHHLVQVNIGRLRAPLDSPRSAGFVEALEPINALADGAPGFVWRLQTDEGDATSIRAFDDDMLIVNLSMWESVEALADFVYRSDHRAVMVQRRSWFERMDEAFVALWWVPQGHVPTVDEAKARIETLRRLGPTAEAFTFRSQFPPPDGAGGPVAGDDVLISPASPGE